MAVKNVLITIALAFMTLFLVLPLVIVFSEALPKYCAARSVNLDKLHGLQATSSSLDSLDWRTMRNRQ